MLLTCSGSGDPELQRWARCALPSRVDKFMKPLRLIGNYVKKELTSPRHCVYNYLYNKTTLQLCRHRQEERNDEFT